MKHALAVLFILFLLTLAIFVAVGRCQEYFKWRTANDCWYTDDKGFHMMGSYFLASVLDKKMRLDAAIITTWLAGLAWEVKDAYIPYERLPYFGGDGFSRYDLMADYFGTFAYVFVNYVLFHPKEQLKVSVTPQAVRLSYRF